MHDERGMSIYLTALGKFSCIPNSLVEKYSNDVHIFIINRPAMTQRGYVASYHAIKCFGKMTKCAMIKTEKGATE